MYKIAVASSDGVNINEHFGTAVNFYIYAVTGLEISLLEVRTASTDDFAEDGIHKIVSHACENSSFCQGTGNVSRISAVEDCRCVLCSKIGPKAQRLLERRAISIFDMEGGIEETLDKIAAYYYRMGGCKK